MAALGRDIRSGQRTLVEHGVDMKAGQHLLVKAPTATGKTLAALMIAGLRHGRGEGRTIIATYTRILQDQYADKDLTDAQRLFPDMPIAVLKGANNYLCRQRAAKIENLVLRKELEASTGDPGEVRHNPDMWPAKADATECKEHNATDCGYAAAKGRARSAHCVITNHTLVLLGAQMPQILGPHTMLIMDEIHNFPRAAESFASREIDLADLVKEAVKSGDRELGQIISAAERCLDPGSQTGNREPSGVELQALAQLEGIERCREIYEWAMDAIAQKKHQHPQRMSTVAKQLRKWPADKRVLNSTWIDIAVVARRGLTTELSFTDRHGDEQTYERAVLMMSATTGTPAHPAYVAERCGLAADVPLLSVESALDYANQMRVSLLDVPMRWSTEDAVLQLIKESAGRTLVLCRSWKSVDMIQQRLFREPDFPYAVHVQSKQNPTDNGAIVGRFRQDTSSVLIGTASLFEGIDVAGESLSQVVIVQLPMLMTMDPLWAERERRAGKRWWPDHQIPSTALILEQMIGRLIRRTTDRGMVAILDPAARRTWGHQAATHALHSFGVRDVSRREAKEWFNNA